MRVAAAMIVGVAALASCRSDFCDDPTRAYIMSQRFVEDRLRSPSTASFPRYSSDGVRVTQPQRCHYEVSGYVDAQNSFGATIRTRFSMRLEYIPAEEIWQATRIVIQ